MDAQELAEHRESWVTHLMAERKSSHTIRTYTAGLDGYARWCDREGRAVELSRPAVEAFTAALLGAGAEAATALSRQRGVRRFSAWMADEGRAERDELAGMKPPKLDDKVPAELTGDQVRALLATCGTGSGREFHDIRDEAIIRLMTESMVRAGELLSMTMDPPVVDIRAGSALVRRGKGGRGRVVPFGPQTGRALDRYQHARRRHPLAASPPYWLARQRKVLAYYGLYTMLRRRGETAGVTVHPHMLRSTGAIRWRAAGGSVPGLLTVAGWTSLEMAQRYVRAAENRLAVDEAHKLGLDDL
jgi:site-specific recombinase XerD